MSQQLGTTQGNEASLAISPALPWLMAIGAGVGVANIYYIQPVVPVLQAAFNLTSEQASLLPAASQVGYAAGMLLLAPLGDLMDRRRLILAKSMLLVVALAAMASAQSLSALLASSLALGLLGSVGQDFIPLAARLATERRGGTIGLVTAGLLSGILLSRTLGGMIADVFGWRAIYEIAAVLVASVGLVIWRIIPPQPPATSGSYTDLLRSLATLVYRHGVLRKALLTQALLAATLGAFWSTIALMLAEPPFNLGASAAGAFGLAGAAGAFGAPFFGRLADRQGPMAAIRAGCLMVAGAFLLMFLLPHSMTALIAGAVLFDLGVMASLVSHQAIVTAIDPTARSRLNGLLMTAAMVGMPIGAAVGGMAWSSYGWAGVCMTGLISGLLALLRSFLPPTTAIILKEPNK